MKNLDRAEGLLFTHLKRMLWDDAGYAGNQAMHIAFELAAKGLLAPDLPAPKQLEDGAAFWGAAQALMYVERLPAVKLCAHDGNDPDIYVEDELVGGPAEARALAAALLAAANHGDNRHG